MICIKCGKPILHGKIIEGRKVVCDDCQKKDVRKFADMMDAMLYGIRTVEQNKEERKMDFKAGDTVKIKEDLVAGKMYGCKNVTPDMLRFAGKVTTIESSLSDDTHFLTNCGGWWWTTDMFDKAELQTEFKIGEKVKLGDEVVIVLDILKDNVYLVRVFGVNEINGHKYKESIVDRVNGKYLHKLTPSLPNEKWGFKIGDLVIHQHRIGNVCGFDKDGDDGVYFTTEKGNSRPSNCCDRPICGKWWAVPFKLLNHYTPKRIWTDEEIKEAKQIIAELISKLIDSDNFYSIGMDYVRINGVRYSSKCHPNDTPNEYIGLMVVLCKSFNRPYPEWLKGEKK